MVAVSPLTSRRRLIAIYQRLLRHHGHAGWWPGETSFEVCVGAILVQNTSWTNVEKALGVLRERALLAFAPLHALSAEALAPLIRSSGCFNVKARRLSAFLSFLGGEYAGRTADMAREDPLLLRRKLLSVSGIGRETADSIVLYAAGLPLFVVDAYTRRIFSRLGLIRGDEDYDEIRAFFEQRLPRNAALFNDYHAQIVRLGKDVCRPKPRCEACPLGDLCARRGVRRATIRGRPRTLDGSAAGR